MAKRYLVTIVADEETMDKLVDLPYEKVAFFSRVMLLSDEQANSFCRCEKDKYFLDPKGES